MPCLLLYGGGMTVERLGYTLDPGIENAVDLLRSGGIATVESCEGGTGHCFPEPTVRFMGSKAEAWRALSLVLDNGLPVLFLRRQWTIDENDPEGPYWELVFRETISPIPSNGCTS